MRMATAFWPRLLMSSLLAVLAIATVAFGVPLLVQQPDRSLVDVEVEGEAYAKALQALTDEQRKTLFSREIARLKAEPLDRTALNNLSLLESLSQRQSKSNAYALESASRTLRDIQSQLTAVGINLAEKKFSEAAYHLDGVLVTQPELGKILYPSVAQMLGSEAAGKALAEVLKRQPPWRADLFAWLIENEGSGSMIFNLFGRLRQVGGHVDQFELVLYLRKLMGEGAFEKAYFVWLDSLDEAALRKVGNVFDGGFDLEPKNQYFDWTITPFANSEISLSADHNAPGDQNLHLSFASTKELFTNVYQYLRLRQGKYVLRGDQAAINFKSAAGLKFVLTCAESGAHLGESEAFNETTPWRTFTASFEVPPEKCSTQILRLQSASQALLDAPMNGEVLFDDIAIDPIVSENPDTP